MTLPWLREARLFKTTLYLPPLRCTTAPRNTATARCVTLNIPETGTACLAKVARKIHGPDSSDHGGAGRGQTSRKTRRTFRTP